MLARLDVPYLAVTPVEFQTLETWGGSGRGLLPVEATMMIAIPELDGCTGPMVFGGRSDAAGTACTGCERHCTFKRGRARPRHAHLLGARRRAGRARGQAGRPAPQRACRAPAGGGRLQLPAECRQHRHRRLPVGVRVAAQPAHRAAARGLHRRGAGHGGRAAQPRHPRQCRDLRRQRQRACAHRQPTTTCGASAGSRTSKRSGARRRASSRATAARSSCWASASATSSSASSRPSATKATRCACCSRRASRRRMPSRPSTAG